jgi:riboflavin synthase
MFTGIVEEIGRLHRVHAKGESMVMRVEANKVLEDVRMGDSIAVNGVCLTVVSFDGRSFTADIMPETYRQTNLSTLTPGSRVNLERAMQVGGRFGGHIMQGHIDGTGTIHAKQREANAVVFTIQPFDKQQLRYIIPRGSIAIDGISLTVVAAFEHQFTVSIIPHTLAQTILFDKKPGETVNLETDILGKYIEHFISRKEPSQTERLTTAFLAENGFL